MTKKKAEQTKQHDGLRLMLQFYMNQGQLISVERNTGVPKELLQRFCAGEDCLSPEQDRILREPLKEYGSKMYRCNKNISARSFGWMQGLPEQLYCEDWLVEA